MNKNQKMIIGTLVLIFALLVFNISYLYPQILKLRKDFREFTSVEIPYEESLNEMSWIQSAIELYKIDQGVYPFTVNGVGRTDELFVLTTPIKYIEFIPTDPFGNNYYYIYYKDPSEKFKELYGDYVLFTNYIDGERDTFSDGYNEYSITEKFSGKGDVIIREKGTYYRDLSNYITPKPR